MANKTYVRKHIFMVHTPQGIEKQIGSQRLKACSCSFQHRRGPKGGVCGKCGGAILSDEEEKDWLRGEHPRRNYWFT